MTRPTSPKDGELDHCPKMQQLNARIAAGSRHEGPKDTCPTDQGQPSISREDALQRAQCWIDEEVPYSMASCYQSQEHPEYGTYRQDCSGYVSMCWALDHSYDTAELSPDTSNGITDRIEWDDLQLGDAIWRREPGDKYGHIALFNGWAVEGGNGEGDGLTCEAEAEAHDRLCVCQEYADGYPCMQCVCDKDDVQKFTPIRYKNIE